MATSSEAERYSSRLTAKADRFVSELLARSLENGWRRADDFIDHFSVESIVESLASDEELRVRLLVETTGTHEKIAAKKSASSAAEDLTLALAEGTTSPDAIVNLFEADDWVRVLGAKALWDFLISDRFWNTDAEDGSAFTLALERLTETIYCAVQHDLINEGSVVDALGFERLAQGLEETQLRELVVFALEAGKRDEPFTSEALLDVMPLEAIIEKVSLSRTWTEVIVQRVIEPLQLDSEGARSASRPPAAKRNETRRNGRRRSEAPEARSSRPPKVAPSDAQAPAGGTSNGASRATSSKEPTSSRGQANVESEPARENKPLTPPASGRRKSSQPPKAPSAPPPPPAQSRAPAPRPQSVPPPPPSARAAAARSSVAPPGASSPPPRGPQDGALQAVVSRLSRLDRLPTRHAEFPAAVLHAIESMYGELATVSDAHEQLNIIKEAFPNDLWRARAMLALLELLNPSAIASTPTIANESADALSIRLLTEERQLSRSAAQSRSR